MILISHKTGLCLQFLIPQRQITTKTIISRTEPFEVLYGCILSLVVPNDTIRIVKPTKGLKPTERDTEVVFTTGGLSEAKPGIIPDAGLLEFNSEGGAPYLQKR